MNQIAVLSDTHGLLRPEVVEQIEGVERILHIGDVCGDEIIEALRAIAPLTVVRGNCDPIGAYPETALVEWGGANFYLLHILDRLDLDPREANIDFVLFGHSHKPASYERDGVRFLNPGSIGPRRFQLPISWATIDGSLRVNFHEVTTA